MWDWLAAYGPTIVICIVLAAFLALLVVGLVRDKKKGKSCCGGCEGCAMKGQCHTTPDEKKDQ